MLTDPEKEDMEVCFPEHSSFHLGGEVYLRVEREEITLKQGAIEMCFPSIRWKMLETYLDDIDEAVHCNRYASLKIHLGGNVYVSAESPAVYASNTVYEFQGCIWHGHRCWITKNITASTPSTERA